MENSVKDIIRRRKSMRNFNGAAIRNEDRKKLEQYLETLDNPFHVPVEFRFLDAKAHDLKSPVIIGTDFYIAAKVSRSPAANICLHHLRSVHGAGIFHLCGKNER